MKIKRVVMFNTDVLLKYEESTKQISTLLVKC